MYCIIVFENIRSAVRPPVNEWPAFSKSPLWLESVFEKMRFSWSLSPNTCGRLGQTRGKKSPFSNKNWYRWTETESWYSVRRTLTRPFYKYFDFKTGTWLKGAVSWVQFILFNVANYSPSIAMELKVSEEITGKWQIRDPRQTNICLLSIIFEVASSRDQLWKTVRLNRSQKS